MAGAQKTSQFTPATSVSVNDEVPLLQGGVLKRVTVSKLTGNVDFEWIASGESWTFVSFNSSTRMGVVTVPSDATLKYTPGNRIRIQQTTGGVKYGIIHGVSSTTLTIFFPVGTTLNNEAITSPVYSALDTPQGFDKDFSLWRIVVNPTGNTANTPAKVTWYRPDATGVITYGVGKWKVSYQATCRIAGSASTWLSNRQTLSTTTNSETIAEATIFSGTDMPSSGLITLSAPGTKTNIPRTVASGTETLNLLQYVDVQGTVHGSTGLNINAKIEAVSAYV